MKIIETRLHVSVNKPVQRFDACRRFQRQTGMRYVDLSARTAEGPEEVGNREFIQHRRGCTKAAPKISAGVVGKHERMEI